MVINKVKRLNIFTHCIYSVFRLKKFVDGFLLRGLKIVLDRFSRSMVILRLLSSSAICHLPCERTSNLSHLTPMMLQFNVPKV